MSDVENNEEVQKAQEDGVVSGAEEEITQECRLEELYNQVCEEAEERDKKMREYTELQFDGLRKFMEESLGDLIPKKAPSSVTAPQVDVTLPQSDIDPSASGSGTQKELSSKQKLFMTAYPKKDVTSAEINCMIAEQMCDDWERPMEKDEEQKYLDLFLPPKNCDRMVVPRVDDHVWGKLDDKVKSEDRFWQNLEKLLLQSQFALQPAIEYFLNKEGEEEDKLLGLMQQSAKMSSLLHKKFVSRRRALLRLHIEEKYKSVAKRDLPITAHLFGEDLDKKVEVLDKTKDIIEKPKKDKIRKNRFARFANSSPGYQSSERFQRFDHGSSNSSPRRPFLEGNGGRRDRQFNYPPKKHQSQQNQSNKSPFYQPTQSSSRNQNNRYTKNYGK